MSERSASKPGEAALVNLRLIKAESSIFKVPQIPHMKMKKKKSTVLDEDMYVEGIAKIIQRDFFPDLEKLKAQNDFLEATENKDYARLREITRKYSGHRPPTEPYNASPATFDTPSMDRPFTPTRPGEPSQEDAESSSQTKENVKSHDITDKQTLDSFLASHTSEDNVSYDRIISLENKKRYNKVADQYEAEIVAGRLADAALALPSIEKQADQTERPQELDMWRYRAKNYIMYVPDGGGSQKPPPKPDLQYHNTRLHGDPFDHIKSKETISAIAKTQDVSVTGKIGVDGMCVGADKPQEGYGFVATPSPRPGDGPDQSPLMTWGEIEGTPFRLDGGDTPLPAVGSGAAYHMLEWGARERIGLQLAEQAAKRRRPTTPRMATPTPNFRSNTERLASMSPAARKLAAKHLLSPSLKLTPNDMGIYTRTPTPKATTPRRRSLVATPSSKKLGTQPVDSAASKEPTEKNNLTDNLLQINVAKRSRMKAQDFFK